MTREKSPREVEGFGTFLEEVYDKRLLLSV